MAFSGGICRGCFTWLVIIAPLLILQALFCGKVSAQNSPTQPVEIKITARRFEFDPHTITVQKGRPLRLIITSADVEHGFTIKEFNVNVKIEANQTRVIEFTPDHTGHFRFNCSVYCGDGHQDMNGELVVEDTQAASTGISVSFDDLPPGVAIVESGGVRFRVDTTTKKVTRIEEENAPSPAPVVVAKVEPAKGTAEEPYDYRLVNVPTPKRVLRHSVNLYFTHRFSEPLRPVEQSARDLLGLDSFAVSSLGVFYGVTDKLYVSAYRSPICQPGLCRTIELGVGYHWLDENDRSPVALSTSASIEGDDRNPDIGGFLFWLGQVNGAPLRDVPKQHAMVCSFITSAEYQQRFSPIVTHNNSECQ
jgi:cytochrome c oxidase subunit 2